MTSERARHPSLSGSGAETNRSSSRRSRATVRLSRLVGPGAIAFASVLTLAACGPEGSPIAVDEAGLQVQEAVVAESREGAADLRAGPTFTPFTEAPVILNRNEVVATMVREYPPLLRDAGIGGTARIYFFINEEGSVEQVRLDESSGHEALDTAALNVAGAFRFSPALNDDEAVPAWVSFPITFQPS